jgi:hypothetical protein
MNRSRDDEPEGAEVMRLWDWSEATKAVPYLHSVVGSLREHWLEVLKDQRCLDRLAHQKGRPNRDQLIEEQVGKDALQRESELFADALEELNQVDVFLLDPVRGLALIPFRKEDDLAWYVFDHFVPNGVVGWRYHHDPIELCRPLEEVTAQNAVPA